MADNSMELTAGEQAPVQPEEGVPAIDVPMMELATLPAWVREIDPAGIYCEVQERALVNLLEEICASQTVHWEKVALEVLAGTYSTESKVHAEKPLYQLHLKLREQKAKKLAARIKENELRYRHSRPLLRGERWRTTDTSVPLPPTPADDALDRLLANMVMGRAAMHHDPSSEIRGIVTQMPPDRPASVFDMMMGHPY